MSDELEAVADWRETLPEQLRDAPYFKDAATPEQARSNIDGAAYWQGNSILKPGADAADDVKAKNAARLKELYPNLADLSSEDIFERLGKPDALDKYTVPDKLALNEDQVISLKQIAFDANLTDKQFQATLSAMDAAQRTNADMDVTSKEEQAAALRGVWGEATDSRKREVERFLRADDSTPAGILSALDNGNMSSADYQFFHKMARAGDEVPEVTTHGKDAQGGMTVEEGQQVANELRDRLKSMKPTDPVYQTLINKLVKAETAAHAG